MQDYLQELQKILLNQIVAYELINPLEIMIAQQQQLLIMNLQGNGEDPNLFMQKFEKDFDERVNSQLSEVQGHIYEALQSRRGSKSRTRDETTSRMLTQDEKENADIDSTRGANEDTMNQMMNTGELTGMQKTVDMADDTRTIGMTNKNKGREQARFDKIKVMSQNALTDFSEINSRANNDEHIDLEKIQKYFKNVINENNFLKNYERIKASSSQQQDRQIKATQQERLMMEKRLGQISSAKKMFHRSISNTQVDQNSNLIHQSHSFMDYPRKTYQ